MNYVYQDVPHHHFFILDWKFEKDSTKILLALKANRIQGIMLTYRQSIVQLRGNDEAANALLDHIDLKKVEIQALTAKETVEGVYTAIGSDIPGQDFRVAAACVFARDLESDDFMTAVINRHERRD